MTHRVPDIIARKATLLSLLGVRFPSGPQFLLGTGGPRVPAKCLGWPHRARKWAREAGTRNGSMITVDPKMIR